MTVALILRKITKSYALKKSIGPLYSIFFGSIQDERFSLSFIGEGLAAHVDVCEGS